MIYLKNTTDKQTIYVEKTELKEEEYIAVMKNDNNTNDNNTNVVLTPLYLNVNTLNYFSIDIILNAINSGREVYLTRGKYTSTEEKINLSKIIAIAGEDLANENDKKIRFVTLYWDNNGYNSLPIYREYYITKNGVSYLALTDFNNREIDIYGLRSMCEDVLKELQDLRDKLDQKGII